MMDVCKLASAFAPGCRSVRQAASAMTIACGAQRALVVLQQVPQAAWPLPARPAGRRRPCRAASARLAMRWGHWAVSAAFAPDDVTAERWASCNLLRIHG